VIRGSARRAQAGSPFLDEVLPFAARRAIHSPIAGQTGAETIATKIKSETIHSPRFKSNMCLAPMPDYGVLTNGVSDGK
jgi:hypothetical protein